MGASPKVPLGASRSIEKTARARRQEKLKRTIR